MIRLLETNSGVTFAVKVHPRARKNAITGEFEDALSIADRSSGRRAGQRGLHRILRQIFEGATIFRYHCLRPDEPE
jgi:hypothetical protein